MFHQPNSEDLQFFESLLGNRCKSDLETREAYNHDHTEDLHFTPHVVLLPETTEEVSKILAYCHLNHIGLFFLYNYFLNHFEIYEFDFLY